MPPTGNPPPKRRATSASGTPARPSAPKRSTSAKPASKLVCTAGPAAGQEFALQGDELVIGRAAENQVSVPDTSVSRKHAIVRKTEDGWALSDLGSGNGTMLNGEAIADETQLSSGDRIALGDSEFEFVDASSATASSGADSGAGSGRGKPASSVPARRPPVRTARQTGEAAGSSRRPVRTSRMHDDPAAKANARRRMFLRIGALLAVMLAGFVGLKAIQAQQERKRNAMLERSQAHDGDMAQAFQDAKSAIRAHKFAQAKQMLEQIKADDPDYDPKSVDTYLDTATKEIPNQEALVAAAKLIKEGEVGKATAELAKVKSAMLEGERTTLAEQLNERITAKIGEARALLANAGDLAKMEQLKAMAEDVLVARPDDRDASDLKRQAENAIQRIKNPNLPPPVEEKPWLEVQSRFRTGDENGAASLAAACAAKSPQCRKLDAQLKDFQAGKKNLDGLNESQLWALYQLDKNIAGGQSSELSKDIRIKVAAKLAVQASKLKSAVNWTGAIEAARRVLEVDPGNAAASAILSEGKSQARDVYLRGYQLRESSPDEAVRLFREVLVMTPADDEYHVKAEQRINEIQKQ